MKFKAKKESAPDAAEKLAWLRLIRTENIGPISFYRLVEVYGSARRALEKIPDMAARGGRSKPLVIPPAATIENEYESLLKMGGDIITAAGADYPLALSALEDAPPVLSYFGDPTLMNKPAVGKRKAGSPSMSSGNSSIPYFTKVRASASSPRTCARWRSRRSRPMRS